MKPVIIGSGLGGLSVALSLAPMPVVLLSPKKLGVECASAWAQGGIAGALGNDDSIASHRDDTLKAGAGLCDPKIVEQVIGDGADVIARLAAQGVAFDRDAAGTLRLGLEAAHTHRRIVHATDQTGRAIMESLIRAVRALPSIDIIEDTIATELLAEDGHITGVAAMSNGGMTVYATDCVVLATGGVGALWQHTTNPLGSWGHGLALAARAGALLGDLEFMQFHPTAIDVGLDPMPLASEALRGEGAILVDETGTRFTDELQSRDVVARAIWKHLSQNHRVFLDARAAIGAEFATRFPGIYALCMTAGIDPVTTPIPVRPAAHYHMGGVVTDARGRTSVDGLWACGEVACTGLHGANRLASNSLLEAASFGRRVGEDILGVRGSGFEARGTKFENNKSLTSSPQLLTTNIRCIMSKYVEVLRDKAGLESAIQQLAPYAATSDRALVGLMIAVFALRREESRGSHTRTDCPSLSASGAYRQTMTLADIMNEAQNLDGARPKHAKRA